MESYRDLKVWAISIDLAAFILKLNGQESMAGFKDLGSALSASVIQISSGIAAAWEKTNPEIKVQEIEKIISETYRLESLIFLAARMGLIQDKSLADIFRIIIEERKMLGELIGNLAREN
jgi:hypothetical protein